MFSEPRAIFFQTELEWPPFEVTQFRIGKNIIRDFYNKMFEAEYDDNHYENLDLQSIKPTLSTHTDVGKSVCQFGEQAVTIEERRPEFELSGFVEIVRTVLTALKDVADATVDFEVPPFFAQRCRIHCLMQPGTCENSLDLLGGKLANVIKPVEPFERPPSFFGVRFRFAPIMIVSNEHDDEGEHHEDFATVRFETYSEDISQVWMEIATVQLFRSAITIENTEAIIKNIQNAYSFLTEKCKAFLDQFDLKAQDESDGDDGDT